MGRISGHRFVAALAMMLMVAVLTCGAISRAQAATTDRTFSALPESARPATDPITGELHSPRVSIEVVLAPGAPDLLAGYLASRYDPASANFHHWLRKGEFDALFAPSAAQRTAVATYLQSRGLVIDRAASPFVVRAHGTSETVASAFKTRIATYRNARGIAYYANASSVELPARFAPGVLGVVGLTNTVRLHPALKRAPYARRSDVAANATCETPYVTRAQLYALNSNGTQFPYGYGAAPGCNGLTPAQENAIYGAPNVGARGKGQGVNLAVFELSAYQHADVAAYVHAFYGAAYRAPLVDISVDGGPLSPQCPSDDTCPPDINGYAGDGEVDADIETQLAVAPAAGHILVYNAPNDESGQTSLDEFSQMAEDDLADVVSSSWGLCEVDNGAAYLQAENVVFEQMALQGQSVFSAAGDDGAFDCIYSQGNTLYQTFLNVDDPGSQPWVTSVGGTSFESFNPGTNAQPAYPAGVESVWNDDELCNRSADEGGAPGLYWCTFTGAGGGGNSAFWERPFYQSGPGVIDRYTTYGNGTTNCAFAPVGHACRAVPDISANADEFTPYAEYCSGSAATPYSECVGYTWSGVGGTSLSTPLWSAIIADRDSYTGSRTGNAGQLLYLLYQIDARGYFHDVDGCRQTTTTNGLFPTLPGFDRATGIGTPKMAALITGSPQP